GERGLCKCGDRGTESGRAQHGADQPFHCLLPDTAQMLIMSICSLIEHTLTPGRPRVNAESIVHRSNEGVDQPCSRLRAVASSVIKPLRIRPFRAPRMAGSLECPTAA